MWFFYFMLGFVSAYLLYRILRTIVIFAFFREMEIKFLYAAGGLEQYKHHAIKIVEISYSELCQQDPEKIKERDAIVKSINEKFDSFGDSWVNDLKQKLPYKTEYFDWKSALKYASRLLITDKR